jgi:hypothetical protein
MIYKDTELKTEINKNIIIIAIAFISALVIIFLAYRFLAPFGATVKYQFNPDKDRDKISKLKGAESVENINVKAQESLTIPQQIIRKNLVTFNLKLVSKKIEGVWVNFKFKGNPKEVKLGARGSEKEKYFYRPLYNANLEGLEMEKISEDLSFYQKEQTYRDFEEFIKKPPVDKVTAVYFFDPADLTMLQSKKPSPSKKNLIINKILRGSHTFYIHVDQKPLILKIEKQDANTYKGEDVLLIEIYKGDKKLLSKEIADDGVTEVGSLLMSPQIKEIKIDNIKTGIYKVILKDQSEGADIRINKIGINQPAFVFTPPIFIADNKPTTIWTNSKKVDFSTPHPSSIQTVKLDDKFDLKVEKEDKTFTFNLNRPLTTLSSSERKTSTPSAKKQEEVDNTREIHKLEIPKNDLVITGDGYFALSEDSFFYPEPIKTINLSTVSDINKVDYIIANYQPVKKDEEWKVAQAYFDPKDIKIDGDKLYFSLEAPELESYGGEIVIDNLEVTVKKPAWLAAKAEVSPKPLPTVKQKKANIFEKIINFFKNLLPKKKNVSHSSTSTTKCAGQTCLSPTTIPTSIPTLTPTPNPKDNFSITIFNGGAGKGAASRLAKILNEADFNNVEATNAASFNFRNASLSYSEKDKEEGKSVIEEIVALLKEDYDTINTEPKEKEKGTINIILGENPKEKEATPSPTVTETP